MFTFDEEQVEISTLTPGNATFQVISIESTFSKSSGNPMLKFQLDVKGAQGGRGKLFEYVVSNHMWKLKNLLNACGADNLLVGKRFNGENAIGITGSCILETEKQEGRKDRVVLKDYLPRAVSSQPAAPVRVEAPLATSIAHSNDIPF